MKRIGIMLAIIVVGLSSGCVDYCFQRRFVVAPQPDAVSARAVPSAVGTYVVAQGFTNEPPEDNDYRWWKPGYPTVDLKAQTNGTYRMSLWTGMCGARDVRSAERFTSGLLHELEKNQVTAKPEK